MFKSQTINILFTSIYNKVSLISSFKQAYKDLGIKGKVVGVDIDHFSAGIHAADKGYIVPCLDDKIFLSKIIEICKKEKINLIIPTRDEDLPYFAEIREQFNKLNIKILAPSLESVRICQDKWKFYEFLKRNNLPLIETYQEYNIHINFPCIVKPKIGKAAKGVVIVKTKPELDKISLKDKIIQEKIKGQEYTIDYFADFNAQPICAVSRIRYKVLDGESKISITKEEPDMVELSKKLAQKLKLIGHNTIQCFKTGKNDIKFLEVNPRFGGGAPLGIKAGCKSPKWILKLLNREELEPIYKTVDNLTMIRHSADIFVPYDKINNF